jgi:hypothetical protein
MKVKGLLIACVAVLLLYSCKKESSAPPPTSSALLLGRWNTNKIISRLYSNSGTKLDSTTNTTFTSDDFVVYYADGTGYYSQSSPSGISLNEFKYKLSGSSITEYNSVVTTGLDEIITGISAHSFSIHVVQLVPDANDPDLTDTQISDFDYTR